MQIGPLYDRAVAGESKIRLIKRNIPVALPRCEVAMYKPLSDTRRPICLMKVTSVALTCLLKAPFAILKTR